jgi:hypothetical protein
LRIIHETPLRLIILMLNNGISRHKHVGATMIYTHVFKRGGRVSEV